MKVEKLLTSYFNDRPTYERTIGRYWATDCGNIKKGYLSSDTFFNSKEMDIRGARMVLTGMAMEDMLTKVFKQCEIAVEPQAKTVMKLSDNVNLVVKPDYLFEDFLVETKYPFSLVKPGVIPERYKYQLECEYRAFERDVYLGVFTIPFDVQLIKYKPSIRRWNTVKTTLENFDKELKEKYPEKVKV